MLPALTLTLCGNMGTPCICSHKGLGLGQDAFKTTFKNINPVCNLHTIGKCNGLYYECKNANWTHSGQSSDFL